MAAAQRRERGVERDIDHKGFAEPRKIESITIGNLISRYIDEFEQARQSASHKESFTKDSDIII